MPYPYVSGEALRAIAQDMSPLAYRMEILAEDVDEAPGALWTRENIDAHRATEVPDLARVVVALDPTATAGGDEAGIIVVGMARVARQQHMYVLQDASVHGSPLAWAQAAVAAYHRHRADRIVAEVNNGGEMVEATIRQVDPRVPYRAVHASRGKAVRAEPVAAVYEQGREHHVGRFPALEDEMCLWRPGDASPNRMDALVWAATELLGRGGTGQSAIIRPVDPLVRMDRGHW